jgi:hypothetical protein
LEEEELQSPYDRSVANEARLVDAVLATMP